MGISDGDALTISRLTSEPSLTRLRDAGSTICFCAVNTLFSVTGAFKQNVPCLGVVVGWSAVLALGGIFRGYELWAVGCESGIWDGE